MSIDCNAAHPLLLEAEPHELRGEGDSPLADHLRTCAACHAQADRLLAANAELDAALGALSSPQPRTRVIPLAPRRTLRFPGALLGAGALAAAAVVATLLLPRPAAGPAAGVQSARIAQALFPTPPVARAEGRAVAVMQTNDPAITVVWVY